MAKKKSVLIDLNLSEPVLEMLVDRFTEDVVTKIIMNGSFKKELLRSCATKFIGEFFGAITHHNKKKST